MTQVTLQAVARRAGVSVSTASRVLNARSGRVPISTATADRVRTAATDVGYVPSAAARCLKTGRSNTLSVIGTSPRFFASPGGFCGEAVRALMSAAVNVGYHLNLLTGNEGEPTGLLADVGLADGLLVLNRDLSDANAHLLGLHRFPKPVVYVFDYPTDEPVDATSPDDVAGGVLAIDALMQRGHRRIGFAQQPLFEGIFRRRRAGWRLGLANRGIEPADTWFFRDLHDFTARFAAEQLTAIVAANDAIGWELCSMLHALGRDDVAVVAFGFDQQHTPRQHDLCVVAQDLSDVVGAAVRRLVGRIGGDDGQRSIQLFDYQLQHADAIPNRNAS